MKTFKIWTYIEECDDGICQDVGDPLSIAEFDSQDEADEYRENLRTEFFNKGLKNLE